jgi:hypothetical protein
MVMGTPAGEGGRLPGPAATPEAPGPETPGAEAPGPEAPGPEAPGLEAPGLEAPGLEAPGLETPGRETGPERPEPPATGPETGDPRVDEALAQLGQLAELPVTEHLAVFEHVHQRLAEVLGDLGTGEPGTGGADSHGR